MNDEDNSCFSQISKTPTNSGIISISPTLTRIFYIHIQFVPHGEYSVLTQILQRDEIGVYCKNCTTMQIFVLLLALYILTARFGRVKPYKKE